MAEDAPMDLVDMMGLRHGQNKVYSHTLYDPKLSTEPQLPGITDWKLSIDGEGYLRYDLSFDTPENAEAAKAFLAAGGYKVQ